MQNSNIDSDMSRKNTATGNTRCGTKPWIAGLYFPLLAAQTAGLAILLVNLIPLYRLMVLDFGNYKPDQMPWWWVIGGTLLIQVAYWLRVQLQPRLPRRGNLVFAHILLFAARMIFVSVTAGFTVMFLNRFEQLRDMNYPPLRAAAVLMVFFSIFCWTLEIERLAKALQERKHESG